MNKIFKFVLPIIGVFLGYFMSPNIPLLGNKVPFIHAISGGVLLKGMDQLLKPLAQESFTYIIGGLVIGFIIGLVIDSSIGKNK